MVDFVNKIADDPLIVNELSTDLEQFDKNKLKNEAIILVNAIVKISSLLILGFGEAGVEIISQNLADINSHSTVLNGKRVDAIFGFCDIRNFTDATEILQEEVMVFVNLIANIIHRVVDLYTGAANKNIGDAFLIVWKIPEIYCLSESEFNEKIGLSKAQTLQSFADLSLISVLTIISKINRSKELLRYRNHEELKKRIPNYSVKLGFGLHFGWAIEGAIGSEYKVDFSYLSPNVNVVMNLESKTKLYGVPIILTECLYNQFSNVCKRYCHKIDNVLLESCEKPMELYTVYLNFKQNFETKRKCKKSTKQRTESHNFKRNEIIEKYFIENNSANEILTNNHRLLSLIKSEFINSVDFNFKTAIDYFEKGYKYYLLGEWLTSKYLLEESLKIEKLNPCLTIYKYIESFNFVSPFSWKGYREFHQK